MDTIRWKQRFENFDKALTKLNDFAGYAQKEDLDVYQVAVIGAFKFTFELGWKTLKDYLNYGGIDVSIPREVIKQAFHHGLIENGDAWIKMLEDRNILTHVYDEKIADKAIDSIESIYIPAIEQVYLLLQSKLGEEGTPCLDSRTTQ